LSQDHPQPQSLERLSAGHVERTIGLTTTIPVEMIFAGGFRPLDLNNAFIESPQADELVADAERCGFPRNSCAWNKGIYSVARGLGLKKVVAVVQGDCSNTHALMEMLESDGVQVIPFAYPYQTGDDELMAISLNRFASALGTTLREAEEWKNRLDPIRALALHIDQLCCEQGVITSEEQHLWTIACSDFSGDPETYALGARTLISEAIHRAPSPRPLRLALVGIPPICEGLFDFLEEHSARVVFNEIPRQFAMPAESRSIAEQYASYTYPYDIFHRLPDIKKQVALRNVHGIIHYVQSFCFRHTQDAIIRRNIAMPILTLECDRPGPLDLRTHTRLEAFLELLAEREAL